MTDSELFRELKNGSEDGFEQLFRKYYASLCLFTFQFLQDREKAEEIVQEVFAGIWAKRKNLDIGSSIKNYLFHAVKNRCLNLIQHEKVEKRYSERLRLEFLSAQDPDPYFLEVGLQRKIEEIFILSRGEGLKYQEIADRLDISVKTVETQMGLALKQLREMLKDYSDYL